MKAFVFCLLLGCGIGAASAAAPATFADPIQRARYAALIEEIRCLVCQNQSLADSNAALAKDLRAQVRRMILAGASDRQVTAYLVERYGDFVLYRPPFKPLTWLLWTGPLLLLAAGLTVAARLVIRRARAPMPAIDDQQRRRAARLLRGEPETNQWP